MSRTEGTREAHSAVCLLRKENAGPCHPVNLLYQVGEYLQNTVIVAQDGPHLRTLVVREQPHVVWQTMTGKYVLSPGELPGSDFDGASMIHSATSYIRILVTTHNFSTHSNSQTCLQARVLCISAAPFLNPFFLDFTDIILGCTVLRQMHASVLCFILAGRITYLFVEPFSLAILC